MYYCDACGWEDACVDEVEVCPVCGAPVRQDEDVLDTWFSSQLWPFATQGWGIDGMDAPDLQKYYPTQLLSTARDIMGLWVARMIMASEYCCDEIPFEDVIIHPTVMGADGKPMSKSRGNGVDPMVLMETYGADGMRFGLLTQVTGSQAMKFNEDSIIASRNFANKIRNAARFVMMNLEGFTPGEPQPATLADRWMFSRLQRSLLSSMKRMKPTISVRSPASSTRSSGMNSAIGTSSFPKRAFKQVAKMRSCASAISSSC